MNRASHLYYQCKWAEFQPISTWLHGFLLVLKFPASSKLTYVSILLDLEGNKFIIPCLFCAAVSSLKEGANSSAIWNIALTKPSSMGHIWPKHGNDMTWPMVLLWVIYGFCTSCCFPYQTHRCYCPLDDLHSIVFYYGISTYFALPHTFPIASTMGMVWLSSIPKPRPTTMGLLRISHHPLAFPYYPSILLPLWDFYGWESTIPFPYHPSLLLLIWDCYGPQSTIHDD